MSGSSADTISCALWDNLFAISSTNYQSELWIKDLLLSQYLFQIPFYLPFVAVSFLQMVSLLPWLNRMILFPSIGQTFI